MSNPFAAPESEGPASPAGAEGCWRDGDLLVARNGAELPRRCVKCNGAVTGDAVKVPVQWMPRWVFALLLLGMLPYLIAFLITRRQGVVHVHLCDAHRQRRQIAQVVLIGSLVALFGGFGVGLVTEELVWLLVGFAFLVPMVAGALLFRTVWAQHIEGETLRLKGADPAFLRALPASVG